MGCLFCKEVSSQEAASKKQLLHTERYVYYSLHFTCSRIKALQELTWDYSYEVGSVEGKVIYCNCKAVNCRGRLI